MTAIKTVFRAATGTKSSRVSAKIDGKIAHTAGFNHAFDMAQNHIHAAQEAAHQLGWTGGKLVSSYLEPGVHVHVWVETPKPAPVEPKPQPNMITRADMDEVHIAVLHGQALTVRVFHNGWFVRLDDKSVSVGEIPAPWVEVVRKAVQASCKRRGWADLSEL